MEFIATTLSCQLSRIVEIGETLLSFQGGHQTKIADAIEIVTDGPNANIDLIFVHGQADVSKSLLWPYHPPASKLELSRSVKNLDHCRIMSFTYATDGICWKYPSKYLEAVTQRLLRVLSEKADVNSAHERPMVFVAHGLGGLIVKNALVEARLEADAVYNNSKGDEKQAGAKIYHRTRGVVFVELQDKGHAFAPRSYLRGQLPSGINNEEGLSVNLEPGDKLNFQSGRYASIYKDFCNYAITSRGDGPVESVSTPAVDDHTSPLVGRRSEDESWVERRTECSLRGTDSFCVHEVQNTIIECIERVRTRGRAPDHSKLTSESMDPDGTCNAGYSLIEQLDNNPARENLSPFMPRKQWLKCQGRILFQLKQLEFEPLSKDTAQQLDRLAEQYEEHGNFYQAEMLYTQTFMTLTSKHSYSAQNWLLAVKALKNAARTAERQGKLKVAIRCLRIACQIVDPAIDSSARHVRVPYHSDQDDPRFRQNPCLCKASICGRLGVLLDRAQDYQAAKEMYKQAMDIRKVHIEQGYRHPLFLRVKENLAVSYVLRGAHKDARVEFEAVLRERKENFERPVPVLNRPFSSWYTRLQEVPNANAYDGPELVSRASSMESVDSKPQEALELTILRTADVYDTLGIDHAKLEKEHGCLVSELRSKYAGRSVETHARLPR